MFKKYDEKVQGSYLYQTWLNIKNGCTNPKSNKWGTFGAKGIRWYHFWNNFEAFKDYCESIGYEEGRFLRIKDRSQNIKPNNICFIKKKVSKRYLYKTWHYNKRKSKKENEKWYKPWDDFEVFKKYCMEKGYTLGALIKKYDQSEGFIPENIYIKDSTE